MTELDIEKALQPGTVAIQQDINGAQAPFFAAYRYIFNKNVPGCLSCINEAYYELLNNYKPRLMKKAENQKYTIKEGSMIYAFNAKNPELQNNWTSANITDEIAEKLIEEGIGLDAIVYSDGSAIEVEEKKSQTTLKKDDLLEIARANDLPEEEYKTLNKEPLAEYLKSKNLI